jgi:hypothetical protein
MVHDGTEYTMKRDRRKESAGTAAIMLLLLSYKKSTISFSFASAKALFGT